MEETDQNEDPKLQVSKFEEAQKSSPDHEERSFRFTEGQQEKVATEGDSQETQVNEKGQLSHEQTIVYFYEKQYRDRHNQQDDPTNKEPSVLDRTGQSEEPKPEMSKIEEPLKSSPNYEESSLEYTERQQEEAATEGDSQQKQVEEKGPLTHEKKNGHLDEMQYRGRQDQQVDPTNKEPSLLEETGQNEEPRPEASKTEKPLKSSPDHEESSLEYTEGQQQDVSTEGDSQEKRVEEKGPLSHEEKNGNVDEIQYRSRHNQNVDPTNKDPSLFEETGQNEEPKPEVSKIEEPLNSNPDHEESSLEYTEGQQEDVSTEGDSQEEQIKEKGPLSHEEQNGNLDEMPDGDRHDEKDATTIKEPPVLEETDQNEDPKLQVPKFEEAQKSSPTIKDLSVFEETGKDKEPKPEVPKIEELLKSSPAHEESLLEYTEGQQEEVATEGDSQETQVNEKGPLSHGEKNGHLDEMQDGDRHDQTDDTTIKEPSVLEETDQNEDPKPEVSKIEEPLKSSPDHEESSLRFTEGQQEKVATEGDSQETQVNEKGQLGQEQTIVHFYEKQDRDRHNQQDDTTNKEPSVLDKIGQSDEPKPEMSKTEKPLKSSPNRDESSLECTERQPEEFASEGHYQVKQGIDKGPLTHEKKNGNIDKMQYRDRHDLKDNSTIKEPSVLDETGQNKEPKPKEPIIEEPLKSSPDQEQSSLEYSEGQQEEVATKGDSQTKQVKEKEPLSDEQKIVHLHEMQDRDRHDQKDDLTNNEPSVLDETGQNKEPKPEVSMIEEPLKSSPDREESSLEYSKGQQEEVSATEGDSQVKQVEEKGPLSHEQKNGNFDEMQYRNRNDQQVDPTVKEPSVLEETGQNEEPKPEGSKIKEPLKSSPDYEESSLEYTEGQQEEVATEGDSQEKRVEEKGPLSHEEKNGNFDEMQCRDRHDQQVYPTIKEPSVLEETGKNEEPKPEVSKIEEPLKSSPDHEESSLDYTDGQQEEVATEGDSQEKQVKEKGPLSHDKKNGESKEPKPKVPMIEEPLKSSPDQEESSLEYSEGQQEVVATKGDSQAKQVKEKEPLSDEQKIVHLHEMQDRDRHDQKDDLTNNEPSVLDETEQNKWPKPEVSMIEEPLKSSPDREESSLEYSEGQQEEVSATEGDSQEKQVEEKGPLSHEQKNGESKEPKPKVPMIEEPLKSSPDQEESSLEYSEGQQEVVATKGDSQAKQVKEKEPLSDEQKIVHLHEMQDRDRHDQKDDLTNNEPSVLDETEQNKWPKPEVSMIEEPLKSSPDHEESTLEYSEGQQEEVETEGDSQEKQAKEKGPLSHEQTNGHLDEMQDRDRHDQKVVPANKEPPVLQETGQNEQPKPEVSEVEEPLKSSPNSLEHPERPQGVVASQDDSRGKREQEKAPMTHGEKCINQEKIQDYDRHDQHDDPRNKNSELQETGENEELKLEGSNLDDSVISNCDNEEMSLEQTERQQVQEKKELRENEAAKVESLVEQPVSDQTESIQTIIEDDAVVTVNNQEISNSNELRISNGKQTHKREPVLPKNKKDVVATQDGSQQVQGEAPVSHGEKVVHLRTIQDYDGRAMHDDPLNNAQSKSVLPETGESKPTTLEEYNIEERLKLYPDYKESSLEYLERHREAATQNDFEEKKVKEKVPLTYEERSLHPGEMQDHDRHIKLDNSKSKDQSVLQETSENEKPKLHASKIEEPLKSFSNNEDRTLECLERQQKEVATRDDSPVKQVQEKALVGHKDQVMHPDKMEELDRQDQQNDSTSKNQSVLQAKEEHKREGLERKEPLESSYNFEEKLLENLEREQVKNKKKMQEDNAVNDGSVVEQADSDKTECLETINEKHAFVSLNNLVNAIFDDDNFQEQQEQDISFVGHEEKFLEELPNRDLIQQHQYGDLTNKDVTVLQETSESQEPKLKATKIEAPLKSTPDYEECSIEYSEKQQEEFDSQDKQVKEKGPSMHEKKIVHLDEMQDLGQHDQQDGPTKKDPSVLQEIGENEEPNLEDAEPEELKIEETLRSSSDYEERSLENPDSNQVQQQKELQKDDVVGENVVEQEVIDKTESIETMIEDISFSASSRVTGDSDEFGKPSSKQTKMTDPILSKCKENEVPLQGDCQDRPVQKEAPVRHQANVVYPEKVEVHDGFYLQDDPANNKQPVVQITNKNEKLKLKEPIKPSFDNEEWSEQREAPVNKKRKSAISLLWCWCCG